MNGSSGEIELSSDELVEVRDERLSLLSAAANARSVAMLTGTHGVVAPPLAQATVRLPLPAAFVPGGVSWADKEGEGRLVSLLRARAVAADAADDPIARLRARLELAYARLASGEGDDGALSDARAASAAVAHAPAAHALLRVLVAKREEKDEQLTHVEHLVPHGDARARADFLTEKGRLLEAKDGPSPESIAAFVEALALTPDHAGALEALEASLDATERWPELAAHLGALAELAEPELAAWLHVERALLLDRRIGDVPAARAALDRALALAPGKGPVRDAAVDHAVLHRDDACLGALLESESALESDPARAARLELDAALAHLRAGTEADRATRLLERAHGRAPTSPLVDVRVAAELARLLEADGQHAQVLRVRKTALRWISDPGEELDALRAIAVSAEKADALDDAVLALERARVLEGDDTTLLAEHDRLLVAAGRHDARAVVWMREAARVEDAAKKAKAFLLAAEATRAAGRPGDAIKYMQSAWVAAPGHPGVFDAIAERLSPSAGREAVAARVALYEQAARATDDEKKRVYYREKIAWLWDDVAGEAEPAARAYEDVLALDASRVSAIVGLASSASRAGDMRKLARALLAEAAVSVTLTPRNEAKLRAAEALAGVEPERALALAQELEDEDVVGSRASELVTRLHADAGRWELVARSLASRRRAADTVPARTALALAESQVLASRLSAPARALATLDEARAEAPEDVALTQAVLSALEVVGDTKRLRDELEKLADRTSDRALAVARLVRAAEIDEATKGADEGAVRLYARARELAEGEPLLADRLRRLGARTAIPDGLVSPLLGAVRALDRDGARGDAAPILATGETGVAALRVAERLARRSRSAPQLANALALASAATTGTMAMRALEGLATLVTWTLPESDGLEPWDRLLELGSRDAVVLDTLAARARRSSDPRAVSLAFEARTRRLLTASDDTERVLLQVELGRLAIRSGRPMDATEHCTNALAIDPASLAAAILLADVAAERGDRHAAITAAQALAGIVADPRSRGSLLRDAADLSEAEGDRTRAAQLLERALASDPESVVVAARLAQLQATRGAWGELARALRKALEAAKTKDAVVPLGSELADVARNRVSDPLLAIEALERVRGVDPGHVPALFGLAELYIGERAWNKGLAALAEVIERTTERDEKVTAHVGRASLMSKLLGRAGEAEKELRAALALDPHDGRVLRGLLRLPSVTKEERMTLLASLVSGDASPGERRALLLELSELRRTSGDSAGAEGALVEAAALTPDAAMLARLRVLETDPASIARTLGRAIARAKELGSAVGPDWYVAVGDIELALGRADAAIERFEEALRLDPSRDGARLALARALGMRGRHETAAAALAPLLEGSGRLVDGGFVRLLEESLSGAGRTQQAHVARELRAIAGELDDAGHGALRARRMMHAANGQALDANALRSFVLPNGLGNHPIWNVAALTSGIAGKLARIGLADQGATTKDRVKPKTASPIRQLFDRLARMFEVFEVELAVSDAVAAPVVAAEDAAWIIVPSSFADRPAEEAVAALARPFARLALGVPWFGALEGNEVLAILIAMARQVAPGTVALPRERVEPLVPDYELRARRAIDRRRKRALEDLEPSLARAGAIDEAAFTDAILRSEARAAFLVSGDLRAAIDALAPTDPRLGDALRRPGAPALATVLSSPLARDLVAYAMTPDATALRRSLGTLWA